MTRPTPWMFFAAVLRPSRGTLAVLLLLAASAAWAAVTDQDAFDQVCVLALFVQMFVASTGYRRPATHGGTKVKLTLYLGQQHRREGGSMTATNDVLDLVGRWAAAEQGNDAEALAGRLANAHIGPLQQPAGPPRS